MKITFQNYDVNNDIQTQNSGNKRVDFAGGNHHSLTANGNAGVDGLKNGIRLDMGNSQKKLFSDNSMGRLGKGIVELQMEMGAYDAGTAKNYRVVMSNTLSEKDYARAQKEGFDYSSMDPEDIVTIQDKVKAELAKSGVVITGYNDDMRGDVLAEAVGSETLARGIADKIGNDKLSVNIVKEFSDNNIPLTDENIENIAKAWNIASGITQPDDGNIAYMIENEMKPTVWNFYLSENSGTVEAGKYGAIFNNIDLNDQKNDNIVRQIENVISEAGFSKSAEQHDNAFENAKWLLNRELPINVESITTLNNIKSVEFPISEESFAKAAMAAVSRGIDPVLADITEENSIYVLAAEYEDKYFSDEMWNETAGDLVSRRQLEEVRLSMTAEVNIKLIQSGFSIDTKPMEQLISALKKAEQAVADRYFEKYAKSSEEAVNSYRLMNSTNRVVQDISSGPASALGIFVSKSVNDITLREFHRESNIARDTYIKAGESYEALMTAPRSDLGDRISKAFNELESLLDSMGIEANETNLRATRILGRNRMEITQDNIDRVIQADRVVHSVIEKMTPSSVLKMIRDGVNPLENSFDSLNRYFDEAEDNSYGSESKDFSEFLYGLEMQDSITSEERESYIGIYRMLHQIEKEDGAAIGTVINERAMLDFNNLISAARSNRFKGMNMVVDDSVGGTTDIVRQAKSITDQIATAFTAERYGDEIAGLRALADIDTAVTDLLKNYNIPASSENLSAMEKLVSLDNNLFEDILKLERKYDKNVTNKSMEDYLGEENFDEKAEEQLEKLDEAVKQLTFEANSYVDVKALNLIHIQLGMISKVNMDDSVPSERDYLIPYDTGDGIGKAHISFRSGDNAGVAKIDIKAQTSEFTVEAHMSLNDNRLEGYFVGNNASELQKLERISDIFIRSLNNSKSEEGVLSDVIVENIPVLTREGEGATNRLMNSDNRSKDADGIHSEGADKGILLQIAKVFLQSVRKS